MTHQPQSSQPLSFLGRAGKNWHLLLFGCLIGLGINRVFLSGEAPDQSIDIEIGPTLRSQLPQRDITERCALAFSALRIVHGHPISLRKIYVDTDASLPKSAMQFDRYGDEQSVCMIVPTTMALLPETIAYHVSRFLTRTLNINDGGPRQIFGEAIAGICQLIVANDHVGLRALINANALDRSRLTMNRLNTPTLSIASGRLTTGIDYGQIGAVKLAFWDLYCRSREPSNGASITVSPLIQELAQRVRSSSSMDWEQTLNWLEQLSAGWRASHYVLQSPREGFSAFTYLNASVDPPEAIMMAIYRDKQGRVATRRMKNETICGDQIKLFPGVDVEKLTTGMLTSWCYHESSSITITAADDPSVPPIIIRYPSDLRNTRTLLTP